MVDSFEEDLRIAIMRLSRRLRLEKPDDAISDAQLSVLFQLNKHGDSTLGELSELERVTPPSMNRTVNALEANGLVARTTSPDDGRKVVLSITDAGRAITKRTLARRRKWLVEHVAELSREDREALQAATAILRGLADA